MIEIKKINNSYFNWDINCVVLSCVFDTATNIKGFLTKKTNWVSPAHILRMQSLFDCTKLTNVCMTPKSQANLSSLPYLKSIITKQR